MTLSNNKNFIVTIFTIVIWLTNYGQNERILIDFGSISSPSPWINISNSSNGFVTNLTNTFGVSTNISLSVNDAFNGINTSGTTSANPSFGIPSTASEDNFFGNDVTFGGKLEPTGGILLANLNPSKLYNVTIFCSRLASDNRETECILQGAVQDTAYINASNNTDSIVQFSAYPSAIGELILVFATGPNNDNTNGFYYLGAMILEYLADSIPPFEVEINQPNGGEFWQVSKTVTLNWINTTNNSTIIEYSYDNGNNWIVIDTISPFINSYNWTIPNTPSTQCFVRVTSDTLQDMSNASFEIAGLQDICTIVVIGSSTAAGTGTTVLDSAWVNRYKNEISSDDTRLEVINLARGGYTTYHLLPNNYDTLATNVGITVDTARNISKALSFNPSGVIVNLPSNDAANNFGVQDQLRNFNLMKIAANNENTKLFVCTTQPRNFSNTQQILIQEITRDSILSIYGNQAIDFWNGIADVNGHILPQYNSGDGVHLNDKGHGILNAKVLAKQLPDSLCGFESITDTIVIHDTIIIYDTIFAGINAHNEISFLVYPNPVKEVLNLKFNESNFDKIEFCFLDELGRLLDCESLEPQLKYRIHLPNKRSVSKLIYLQVTMVQESENFKKVIPLLHK